MHSPTDAPAGTWRQLLSGRYLGTATVLAGGVALYATNVYLTTSLLPTAIDDIGGQQYYAWTATVLTLWMTLVYRLCCAKSAKTKTKTSRA